RALAGDRAGFRELAVYAESRLNPRIMRDLWKAGAPLRPHRATIKHEWKIQASLIVAAFDEDLDAFLPDAGFSTARLPEEFDVWRGGDEPAHVMARGRSW